MELKQEFKRLNEQLEQETKLVQDKEATIAELTEQIKNLEAEKTSIVELQEQVKQLTDKNQVLEAEKVEIVQLKEQIKTLENEKASAFVITKEEYVQSLMEQVQAEHKQIVQSRLVGETKDEIKASFDKEVALVKELSEQLKKSEPAIIGSPTKREKSLLEEIADEDMLKKIKSRGEING